MAVNDYWQSRAEQRLVSAEQKALRLEKNLKREFNRVYKNIEAEIAKLYFEFAQDGQLDYGVLKQKLSSIQKKQFRKDLEYYIENSQNEDFVKKLNALYKKTRLNKLEAVKASIEFEVHNLYEKYLNDELQLELGDVLDENYYRTIFDIQQFQGFGVSFTRLSPNLLESLLDFPWSGKNYSEKIWGHVTGFSGKLESILTSGIIQGKSNQKMAAELSKATDVEYKKAIALVRTETNYIANEATSRAYQEYGVEEYQYLATLDFKTSPMCRAMDGMVFKLAEKKVGVNYPPLHTHCRSTTVPYFKDLEGERIARDEKGKTYKVDRHMKYNDWYEKYVENGEKQLSMELASVKVGDSDGYSRVEKIGKIDYTDNRKISSAFKGFAKEYADADIEHALIVASDSSSYSIKGIGGTVGIQLAGKESLKGAKVIHNHPDDGKLFGDAFSRDDFKAFFYYGLSELQVSSGLGRFSMSYSGEAVDADAALRLYDEAMDKVLQEAFENMLELEYMQFEAMKYLSKTLEGLKFKKVG